MEYIFHIIIMINIYVMLVLSANLPVGMANLLSMCQAAFYGIGAYIGTYVLMQLNLPFLLVTAIVMAVVGMFSLLVSFASVKLKGDYFILATLGFQMIVYTILYNWTDVTRGPYGIPGIPSIKLFGVISISGVFGYFALSLLVAIIVAFLFLKIKRTY